MALLYPEIEISAQNFAAFLREEISKEKMVTLDFYYISDKIDAWWLSSDSNEKFYKLKAKLIDLLFSNLEHEHIQLLDSVGLAHSKIAAICIKNIFKIDSPKLALLVHESLSDLFHVTDIKYEYEEHKTLYLKEAAIKYRDWGSGYGEITPHSDDIYENLNIDYLSLTTCRDSTKTPTKCFFPKNFLVSFNYEELFRLKSIKAKFKSGKNVDVLIERERNVLEYSEKHGFRFFLDFRIDNITGERMVPCSQEGRFLLDKIRNSLESCQYESSIPETGSFFIVANHKVLHARGQMNLNIESADQFSKVSSLSNTPRLLYRSKGPRREYLDL